MIKICWNCANWGFNNKKVLDANSRSMCPILKRKTYSGEHCRRYKESED